MNQEKILNEIKELGDVILSWNKALELNRETLNDNLKNHITKENIVVNTILENISKSYNEILDDNTLFITNYINLIKIKHEFLKALSFKSSLSI